MAHAGWAQVDITPVLGSPVGGMGVPAVIANRVRDRLLAGVILLKDDQGNMAAIVSLDVVGITPQWGIPLRMGIAAMLGCPISSVLLNASHTHSGGETIWDYYATSEPMPWMVQDYLSRLSGKVLTAVQSAASRMAPATVTWHKGETLIAINRRLKQPDGTVGHRPNPAGFVDRELDVLSIVTPVGQAVLYCAACHTVSVYGAQPDALSSDFIAATRAELGRQLPAGTHTQFAQGFAGDCRPQALSDFDNAVFRPARPGDTEAIGHELATDVLNALRTPAPGIRISLGSAECFMPVMPGEPISRESLVQKAVGNSPTWAHLAKWWLLQLDAGTRVDEPIGWSLGALKLSPEHWIMHTAGEPVGKLATIVRVAVGASHVAALGYTQDYTAYLPTDEMLPEGGYEVFESNIYQRYWPAAPKAGIDQMMHDYTQALVAKLRR
jgi:neutral ceramidase